MPPTVFERLLEDAKNVTKVLILGPYRTLKSSKCGEEDTCEKRLQKLKAFLRGKGFHQTRLVKDWIDEKAVPKESFDIHFRDKSFYYMDNWAEILLFVFFMDCDNLSVAREWGHMIEFNIEKCGYSIILRHEDVNLGAIIRGDIKKKRVFEYPFKDEDELHDLAFSGCFNILYSLI